MLGLFHHWLETTASGSCEGYSFGSEWIWTVETIVWEEVEGWKMDHID